MAIEKLIFWDIDGTLLHCGSDGRKALNRTFLELYKIEDAFGSSNIGGSMDYMILKGIMDSHSIEEHHLTGIMQHYEKVLIDTLEKNQTKRILPGVKTILDATHANPKCENALLTSNLKIGAMAKLNSLGLGHYFSSGGFGDEPGEKWDVAKDCIRKIEKKYNTVFRKEQMYLIGDSTYDIKCANEVGMTSIAVSTGWSDEDSLRACNPDYYFDDLSDTGEIIRIIG